jgi:hypothetical protein
MPAHYAWADIVVGCTPRGGLDKGILEGMAAGCIPLTSNEAMRPHLEGWASRLLFAPGDAAELTDKLAGLDDWAAMSHDCAAIVRREHEVAGTVKRISELT